MSVTEREVPFEVATTEGDVPTEDEFGRVLNAMGDVAEFGLGPLIQRVAGPLVDAFESESKLQWTYEDVGRIGAHADLLASQAEVLLRKARTLQALRRAVAEAVWNNGAVDDDPPCNRHGGEYRPSPEVLERWARAGSKDDNAR